MINWLIAVSVRYRAFVIVAAAALAVLGVRAVQQSPVDAIPDLSENQVLVFAAWPGHSPQEIEDQVTYPLALQLQGVDGVRVVRSSSDVDYSLIHVIFDDRVAMHVARQRVGERIRHGDDAAGRDAGSQSGRGGHRTDLLVHGRRRRARSWPAAGHPGLVHPPATGRGAGRRRSRERRRRADRVSGRT